MERRRPFPLLDSPHTVCKMLGEGPQSPRDYRPLLPPDARRKVISLPLITISEVATFV